MEYVLIFQLPGSSKEDFDELIELEESVRDCIEDLGTVDGHDIGSDERNIFIFTSQQSESGLPRGPRPGLHVFISSGVAEFRSGR